ALWNYNKRLSKKKVVVSGTGNVSTYTVEKATQLGAKVIDISDSQGYIYDEKGVQAETLKELAKRGRGALKYYKDFQPEAKYCSGQSVWAAQMKYDIAFPCATQNYINQEKALNLAENCEIKALFEGANMPSTDEAIKVYKEKNILYGLGKAANAGGVAVSALEKIGRASCRERV